MAVAQIARTADIGKELSSIDFGSMIGGPLNAAIEAQAESAESSIKFIQSVGFDENKKPIYVDFEYDKFSDEEVSVQKKYNDNNKNLLVFTNGEHEYAQKVNYYTTSAPNTEVKELTEEEIKNLGIAEKEDGTRKLHEDKYPVYTRNNGTEIYRKLEYYKIGNDTLGSSAEDVETTLNELTAVYTEEKTAEVVNMHLKVPILTMLPIPFIRIDEITVDFNAKINSMARNNASDSYNRSYDKTTTAGGKVSGGGSLFGFGVQASGYASTKMRVSSSYQRKTSSTNETKKTYSLAIHVKAVQDEMPAGMERILNILEENIQSTPKES